jgi:hypothetical protein
MENINKNGPLMRMDDRSHCVSAWTSRSDPVDWRNALREKQKAGRRRPTGLQERERLRGAYLIVTFT